MPTRTAAPPQPAAALVRFERVFVLAAGAGAQCSDAIEAIWDPDYWRDRDARVRQANPDIDPDLLGHEIRGTQMPAVVWAMMKAHLDALAADLADVQSEIASLPETVAAELRELQGVAYDYVEAGRLCESSLPLASLSPEDMNGFGWQNGPVFPGAEKYEDWADRLLQASYHGQWAMDRIRRPNPFPAPQACLPADFARQRPADLDATDRKIINKLAAEILSGSAPIARALVDLPVDRKTAAKHLTRLFEAGLVRRPRGRERLVIITDDGAELAKAWAAESPKNPR